MTPLPIPAPNPSDVRWNELSDRGAHTLAQIAVRVQMGHSHQEISEALGISQASVAARLRALRKELRAVAQEDGECAST